MSEQHVSDDIHAKHQWDVSSLVINAIEAYCADQQHTVLTSSVLAALGMVVSRGFAMLSDKAERNERLNSFIKVLVGVVIGDGGGEGQFEKTLIRSRDLRNTPQASRYRIMRCTNPECGPHIVAFDADDKPICEICIPRGEEVQSVIDDLMPYTARRLQ